MPEVGAPAAGGRRAHRGRWGWLALMALAAPALGGCTAGSVDAVSSESVVVLPLSRTLLLDGAFTAPGRGPWQIDAASGLRVAVDRRAGRRALTLSGRPGVRGPVVMAQSVALGVGVGVGARFRLTVQVRTHDLSCPVATEIQLLYRNGSDAFVEAEPIPGEQSRPDVRLRGSTRGWIPLTVRARATRPPDAVAAWLVDCPAGFPFHGSVSVAGARLELVGR